MLALLLGLAALAAPAAPSGQEEVSLSGARWHEMIEVLARGREQPPPGPWVADRAITFEAVGEGDDIGLLIRGRWTLRALRPGWFLGDLFGPGIEVREATWDRRPAGLVSARDGTKVAGFVRGGEVILEAVAFVPGDPLKASLTLDLLPAVRGALTLPAPRGDDRYDLRLAAEGPPPPRRDRQVFTGAGELVLSRAAASPEGAESLITASAGLGLTFGDAELRARAHVTYEVRRGQLGAVTIRAPGLGADLTVTGRGIREWRREGDRIVVDLQAPVRDRLDLELQWTQALAKSAESSMTLPQIAPEGVFRATSALQIARDGEVEVIPELSGWTAVASADLPEWSRDLVEGTPTAAFTAGELQGGRLALLRFVPVAGPPVVVDVADYTIATSREGRVLMQARYEVRNERAAHLRITPPPGMKILGARVAGETALPARGPEGAWLVPLKRSLETVKGTLSFPVEVILLGGDDRSWRRRETRTVPLPRVSAPVAVVRSTVHLPPGYISRKDPGDGDVVDDFTRGEGITYGLAIADPSLVAEAEGRFQTAVSSFLANDFEAAQKELDDLRSMGASNENIERLQANLDVIQGKGKDQSGAAAAAGTAGKSSDTAAERRIKEQAKARASAEIQAQAELEKKAEAYRQAGDYDRAEEEYSKAIAIGSKLALLEQDESVEQQRRNQAIESQYKAVSAKKKSKKEALEERERKSKKVDAYARFASTSAGHGASTGASTPSFGAIGSAGIGGEASGAGEVATGSSSGDDFVPLARVGGVAKAPARLPDGSVVLKPKPTTPSSGGGGGSGSGGGGSGELVYLFDDDDDGVLLHPEGANIASRASAQHASLTGGVAPTTTTDKITDLTETPNKPTDAMQPVGGVSRDFTAVVEVAPTAGADSEGIRLAGTTGAESKYVVDGANVGDATRAIVVQESVVEKNLDDSLFDEEPARPLAVEPAPRYARARGRAFGRRDAAPTPEPTVAQASRQTFAGRRAPKRRTRETLDTKYKAEQSREERPRAAAPAAARSPVPRDIQTKTPPPVEADGDGIVDEVDLYEPADEAEPVAEGEASAAADGRGANDLGRLAAPQSTASAVSVVIPAAGEAVLYQHLLLAADAPYALEIGARAPLRPRKRR